MFDHNHLNVGEKEEGTPDRDLVFRLRLMTAESAFWGPWLQQETEGALLPAPQLPRSAPPMGPQGPLACIICPLSFFFFSSSLMPSLPCFPVS